MQWTRPFSSVASAVIIALIAVTAADAQKGDVASLIIGKTVVKLGASKNVVIPAIAFQYVVKPFAPNCAERDPALVLCRVYNILDAEGRQTGHLEFDIKGDLIKASIELLPGSNYHSEGEIGSVLVAAIGALVAEGQTCSLAAASSESVDLKDPNRIPDTLFRQGIIECGSKRIRIQSIKEKATASMQITEEIGCPVEVLGGCQR